MHRAASLYWADGALASCGVAARWVGAGAGCTADRWAGACKEDAGCTNVLMEGALDVPAISIRYTGSVPLALLLGGVSGEFLEKKI